MAQCYEEISSFLLSLDNDRRECVTLEGTANFFKEFNARTYIVKFTNSNYNEKKVIVANITDTTDRDAVISLKLNNEYKSRLLASVSHELRTPLNGSINFTEEALNSPDVPESVKQKLLLPALRSSRMLLLLINDILDFSQMQANKLRLVFEKKNIVHIASECIELLEIQAAKKGVKLRLDSHLHRYQEKLLTDHNRVKQIILNLLSNAVKFTFQGQITITLEPKTIEGRRAVRISCADTGIGIDEENQKKLFKAFEKIDLKEKVSLNPTGVGLGLVISNNLAECLGQEANLEETTAINFKSKVGEGTTFWFDLVDLANAEDYSSSSFDSLAQERSQIIKYKSQTEVELPSDRNTKEPQINLEFQRSITPHTSNLSFPRGQLRTGSDNHLLETYPRLLKHERSNFSSSMREICTCPPILVVDDDPFNITALEQHLSKFNLKCDCAFNGKQAIEKIVHRHENRCNQNCSQYKLVFLDCNMPVMNGFQAARLLREKMAKNEIEKLKIVACTAFVQPAEIEQALAAGMDDFCTKPITFQVVKEKIKSISF